MRGTYRNEWMEWFYSFNSIARMEWIFHLASYFPQYTHEESLNCGDRYKNDRFATI